MTEAEILATVHALIWIEVYTPFFGALTLVCAFFWKLHETTRQKTKAMVDERIDLITESQKEHLQVLKEISHSTHQSQISIARMEERIKAIDSSIDRRDKDN